MECLCLIFKSPKDPVRHQSAKNNFLKKGEWVVKQIMCRCMELYINPWSMIEKKSLMINPLVSPYVVLIYIHATTGKSVKLC